MTTQAPTGFLTFEKGSIKLDDLATAVSDVLMSSYSVVELLCQTKGGWEGWLQGALSIHLVRNGHEVQREALVYGDLRAADLLIGDSCVIELKALGMAREVESFFDGVDVDVAKLQGIGHAARFGVVVVPGFSTDVYRVAKKRLGAFTEVKRECSGQINLFVVKNP